MNIKKFKPNKVSKNVGCIAEFKKRAILRFCNVNRTKSYQFNEIFHSNGVYRTGL